MSPITDSQWVQDLTEHGDVEANPGPRACTMRKRTSLRVFSLNCGGAQNVWNVFQDINKDNGLDVMNLQELSRDSKQMKTFSVSASQHGWTCFFTLGRTRGSGGGPPSGRRLYTLVRKGIPCTSRSPVTETGGRSHCCPIFGTVTLINCYVNVSSRLRKPFLESLFEIIQSLRHHNLILLGNFNETPSESTLVRALQLFGWCHFAPRDGLGSRWNAPATRIIDYVLNQYDLVYIAFDEHWSDHRAFQFDLDHKFEFSQGQQTVPCNTYLPKNPEDFDAWSQHLNHQWKAQLQVWDEFYSSLDSDVPDNNADAQIFVNHWSTGGIKFPFFSKIFCCTRLGLLRSL